LRRFLLEGTIRQIQVGCTRLRMRLAVFQFLRRTELDLQLTPKRYSMRPWRLLAVIELSTSFSRHCSKPLPKRLVIAQVILLA
jgi:hypothetical protein